MIKFNRNDYLEGKCTWKEYYQQFSTKEMIALVTKEIGLECITKSTDRMLNDIPIERWNKLLNRTEQLIGRELSLSNASTTSTGQAFLTDSTLMSVLKATGIKIRESNSINS